MKSDLNTTLNKLVSYAFDNLLLDPLDGTYTLNRLAKECGASAVASVDADYGDMTLDMLLAELKASSPTVDLDAVKQILFPMPRTIGRYFADEQNKSADKALSFLFELYEKGGYVGSFYAPGKNGYCYSTAGSGAPISLDVGEPLLYTPLGGGRVGMLQNPDILSDDIVMREINYVNKFGGVIATRIGDGADYLTASNSALQNASVKEQLSDGAVKVALLDYPVPALAFNGIAKNAVAREAVRVIKAAADSELPCVVAAAATNGVTVYIVFATEIKPSGFVTGANALAACGVYKTTDCSPLLSVLEKGTALSSDLFEFKPIYDKIGGVKLAGKALSTLADALADTALPLLKAAASADEAQAKQLVLSK